MIRFFANIIAPKKLQSQILRRKKLRKKTWLQKAAHKM